MFAPRLCLAVIALSAIAVVLAEGEEDATIEAAFEEEPLADSPYIPRFMRNRFNLGSKGGSPSSSGVKGGTKSVKGGHIKTGKVGIKTGVKTGRINAGGAPRSECGSNPPPRVHALQECSKYSGCRVTCDQGYEFPNGKTQVMVTCQDGVWRVGDTEWAAISTCRPICSPECQNRGICVEPNQCNCPENYSGPQCQFKDEPCLNQPPPTYNARRRCNSHSCTITCMKNHTFPDGSAITNLICKNGNWVPTNPEWVTVPDCKAVCSPPCQNGGNCLALDVCQCPEDFRGPQCQYSVDACDVSKLGFNGGYNCSGDGEKFACGLNCPDGIKFESTPASVYTCLYSEGVFKPQPVPQCKIESNMRIIPIGGSKNSYFETTNSSWSTSDRFRSTSGTKTRGESKTGVKGHTDQSHGYETDIHNGSLESENMGHGQGGTFGSKQNQLIIIEQKRPEPSVCFTWGGVHYKTFDGKIFSFESDCAHTLVRDSEDGLFTITTTNSPGCRTGNTCFRIVKIFLQGKEYTLSLNDEGLPEFRNTKKALAIPAQLPGIRVEMSAHFMVVTLDSIGASLKWDGGLLVQVQASESLWNRTAGLCGNMNGDNTDDMTSKDGARPKSIVTLASSWKAQSIGETCDEYPSIEHSCNARAEVADEASRFCSTLLADRRYQVCSSVMDLSVLETACRWDYCGCKHEDKKKCACDTMSVYIRQCAHKGIIKKMEWRDDATCPMKCSGGRVYMSCGPKTQASCGAQTETKVGGDDICEEGCFCPEGSVLHDGKCISREECPCKLRGKVFHPGASTSKDCNTCTCSSGKWVCTEAKCSARCAAIGDPHYSTFDGKRYDFMGKCTYYLVKGDNYTIEGENVACPGAISENMAFTSTTSDAPSCTKTVTIRVNDVTIKLKQNRELLVNGEEVSKLPVLSGGVEVRVASSIFIIAKLPNGIEVWWDGISRVYVNAPAEFHGKTKGLCGTFTMNQKDDFATPDGDVEQAVIPFANKWKTDESCPDAPKKEPTHPCEINPQKRVEAEKYCSKIHSQLFSDCHWHVDPEPFYKDCMYDMCACETDINLCLCPILAAYGKECAHQGLRLAWRHEIDHCKVHCPGGQSYQVCGNSCTRSCGDISFDPSCRKDCVEGCNCPEGQTLDDRNECIPIGQCPCQHAGLVFKAGYREVRPGTKSQELCTCASGVWNCQPATLDEIDDYPAAADLKSVCSAAGNQELSTCLPVEPKTCRNMLTAVTQSPAICKPGCVCKKNYVLDVPSGKCVKEDECPCYHGGKSYKEGSSMQEECNTCKCNNGKWNCTDRICDGVCSAWGDSHYTTFDGKLYEFQGVCDYVLAKGALSPEETFDVSTQNVPCGTTGVTCSKSITLIVGKGENQETITLTKGKELPEGKFERIAIRRAGLFVFLDVPDLGLVVQWDEGTRVYVRLNPKWQGRTKGLCGDYNNNAEDDFKTPSGGIPEVSANLFGDSWKKQTSCPESKEITDTCLANLERKTWAKKKCGLLKSPLFQACHSEVEVEPYLERCVFDTCGCDVGGDCECLCTALAAYAQECNSRGVPVKWRSQKLCPMQCDENCSTYSPCISTCPRETCDNLVVLGDKSHLCGEDTCVEGCLPKACPDGEIYQTANYSECVPRATCKPVCMTIDEVTYYEGDKMESDDCHSCFCSRGKKICTGEPCPTTPSPRTTVPMEEEHECIDGWTAWVNKDLPVKGKKVSDVEPLPMTLDLYGIKGSAVCTKDLMVDIRCRSVDGHLTPKETGLNVECSLERGLYCTAQQNERPCVDFEISVLCKCAGTESVTEMDTTTELTTTTTSTTTAPPKYLPCDVARPNQPHPKDCHAFYQCVPGLEGPELVEKSCGPDMLYNPDTQVCDWPATVALLRPECGSTPVTTVSPVITTTAPCKDGEIWSECAVQCSRACHYYKYLLIQRGICDESRDCVPGCVPADKVECPPHKLWRDDRSCVNVADCTCRTHDNKPIKPGVPVRESECEICQCLRNVYTCDDTICTTTTTIEPIEATTTVAPETSVLCNRSELTYLVNGEVPLSDEAFKASGYSEEIHKPSNARLNETSKVAWEPEEMDQNQWISVDLGNPETIFGVILQGSPLDNKYVKTYNVYYSPNGDDESFEPVTVPGTELPKIFHGPKDTTSAKQALFDQPFVAQKIKIAPKTWHRGIALRFEVIGCDNLSGGESGRNQTRTQYVSVNKSIGLVTEPIPISNYTFVVTTQLPMLEECAEDNYQEIIYGDESNVVTFDASSVLSPEFAPENAKLDNQVSEISGGSWEPADTNDEQWLDIKLPEPEPIYGIILQGSPGDDKYVTSYKVLYSEDGVKFSYILDSDGEHEVFSGSVDPIEPIVQIFYYPIEAKIVRINPHTWYNGIAMRAELIGCRTDSATNNRYVGRAKPTSGSSKHIKTVCDDPMGLEDSMMSDQQISASSTLDDSLPNIRFSADGIWRAKYDNPDQFVEFDFYEPRNLTGVETKGYNNIWTTTYKVLYSHDRRQWNPVANADGLERKFLGNYNDKKSRVNYFDRPIHARYLRIQPITWHQHVGLKAEIRGCFLPYPITEIEIPVTTTTKVLPSRCNVCEGIPEVSDENCKCDAATWWDGDSCVTKQECPCVIGHIPYAVGSVYETEDCRQCTCTLGGASSCVEKKCEPCKTPGLQSVQTELCSCVCKPCPTGTRLCPRSNICINEASWCNGVEDCLDDETDCVVTEPPPPPPTVHKVYEQTCQQPTCPPGYKVVMKSRRYVEVVGMLRTASYRGVKGGVKGGAKGGVKGGVKGGSLSPAKTSRLSDAPSSEDMECPEYSCVSTKPPPPFGIKIESQKQCPKEICPPGYKVILEKMNLYYPDACPRYRCKPPPPTEAVCNVTGRTFNTFDNLEYKYDICNHLLARELAANKWYITLEKRCNKLGNVCEKVLLVYFDGNFVYMYPDLHIDINEFTYSPNQVKQLTDRNKAFKITRVGNILHFVSYHYGFWVIWDMNSNTKIGVTTKLSGHVDGLCGYYDGHIENDKRLPDGEQARRTVDFGNSWALEDTQECEPQVCPQHVQEEAWNICNTVKQRSLAVCSGVLDLEKFVSRCLENVCNCLRGNLTASECRCRELTAFVSECQAADPSIDLSTWRTTHDCPVSCPAPFVHKDCFRYKCESTCNNLQEIDPCPVMPGVCFSGCFCPDGLVRRGEECVLPTECRDCLCDGFGNSKFVSFDRQNFTFTGNCTYVLSRDITNDIKGGRAGHTYQVLVTNVACPAGVCTEAITVLYQKHSVQIKQGRNLKELMVFVDRILVSSFPHNTEWLTLEEAPGRDITLLIPAIQLEIASFQHNFAFMVRLPSHTFGGAMEGLCGDCNENIADDMRRRDGKIVDDATDFGNSWLVNDAPAELNISNEKCIAEPEKECVRKPSDTSPCDKLLDAKQFGQCHEMVDPKQYLEMCRQSLCNGDNVCDVLEAYARSCLQAGLCPSWRTDDVCPYNCPSHLEYRACGFGCQETCSDIESGREVKCTLGSVEGCFCPGEKILVNDTCVSRKQCLVCDEEGHIEGDWWTPDKCTNCHCNKKVVTCEKYECPALETICAEGLTPILATGTEDECCAKYLCIPITTTTPTCVEQQQPVCGNGQIMKTVSGSDGCQKLICECIPAEECPSISTETLEPGMVEIRNTSGCCPWSEFICKPETCPEPTPCKEFYEPKSVPVPGHCCPSYECKLKPNVCTYEPKFIAGTKSKSGVSYKRVGDKWQDGPCTICECEKVADGHEAKCVTTECPTIETHPDINEFVIEAVLLDKECCSTFKRTACKDQSNTYTVGEEWQPDLNDACKKLECINETFGVQKRIKVQECDKKCELGYEYREPENKGAKCCGECIPVACVIDGKMKNIGEEWQSDDHCNRYSCSAVNGSLQVRTTTETCTKIDDHENEEFEIEVRPVEGKCCPEYVVVGCRYNGVIHKPGDKWISPDDPCLTEMCIETPKGVTKKQEIKTCNKQCALGWEYQEPERDECCGECKQLFCVDGDILHKPEARWSSADNCTTFECLHSGDQFLISASKETCPDVSDCAKKSIYQDGCCKRCNLTSLNQQVGCAAELVPSNVTAEIVQEIRGNHGLCKNLNPIEGLTECQGRCKSSTYLNRETYAQESDCKCCAPMEYKGLVVELTCIDGAKVKKSLNVPKSCTCEPCLADKATTKGRKAGVKTVRPMIIN